MAQVIIRISEWWWSKFTLDGFFCWIVGGWFALMGAGVYHMAQPPAHLISAKVDDGLISLDGRAVVLYNIRKNTDCAVDVTRWIYSEKSANDPKTGPIFDPIVTSSSPPVPVGVSDFGIVLHVPMDTPDGIYFAQSRAQYWGLCGVFHPHPINSIPVRLQVFHDGPGLPPRVVVAPIGQPVTVVPQGPMP